MVKYDIKCPSCGLANSTRNWKYQGGQENRSVMWCGHCEFGWLYPFPSKTDVSRYYTNQRVYYQKIIDVSQGGFPLRIERLNKLSLPPGRLLDVGSGLGHFLNHARNSGWTVEGIEPRVDASKHTYDQYGIKVHTDEFEIWADSQRRCYDVITLWDVLEHVHDPFVCLEKCVSLLQPGGLLVLSVPNASGLLARLFKGRWRYVMETHLSYFTMRYLHGWIVKHHLDIEREDHTLKLQSFIDGFISLLPAEKIFDKKIHAVINKGTAADGNEVKNTGKSRLIDFLLPLVLKFNMSPIPFPIGDLVDIYCRKK
jgi:2-polyprenyl-3-methyl-5-hydroxy-6-metoxy-1,4-benzoquinol methylase